MGKQYHCVKLGFHHGDDITKGFNEEGRHRTFTVKRSSGQPASLHGKKYVMFILHVHLCVFYVCAYSCSYLYVYVYTYTSIELHRMILPFFFFFLQKKWSDINRTYQGAENLRFESQYLSLSSLEPNSDEAMEFIWLVKDVLVAEMTQRKEGGP